MRICFVTKEIPEKKVVDGRIEYGATEMTKSFIDIWQSALPNASFFFTDRHRTICEERLRNNESDLSLEAYPIQQPENDSHFFVPVPVVGDKVSILTGYDAQDISTKDVASAINSVNLLEPEVYMLVLAFFLLFALTVIFSALLTTHRELLWLDMIDWISPFTYRAYARKMRRQMITQPCFILKFAMKQVLLFFRDSSSAPRMTSILVTLLAFGLVTFFSCFFSTKSIVEEKPTILNTYEKLANHRNASVFFSGTLPKSSDSFRRASPDTLKGRIWARFIRTPASKDENIIPTNRDYFAMMRDKKYSVIATYSQALVIAWALCALRSEGQLRLMQISADPSEPEELLGYAVSTRLRNDAVLIRRLTLFAESGIMHHFMQSWSDVLFSFAIVQENLLQRVACLDGVIEQPKQLSPVPLHFWTSFFYSWLAFIFLALFILLLECLLASLKALVRRSSQIGSRSRN